jgi:hypothetical protein
METCMPGTHLCVPGVMLVCNDAIACTMDSCDPARGCIFTPIDVDRDGHTARMASCGDDCNDGNPAIYPGAEELCDMVDNDCDMMTDEVAPTWYVDCDRDTFAASTAGSMRGCTAPLRSLAGCAAPLPGGWTSTRPSGAASTDCYDSNALVRPNQTDYQTMAASGRPVASDFDYDCDMMEERRYTACAGCGLVTCSRAFGVCFGASYWTDGTVPACGAPAEQISHCTEIRGVCARYTANIVQPCL